MYTLTNGEARHAEAPDTFYQPSRAERESVPVGVFVKAMFEVPGTPVERMWIKVAGRTDGGGYVGTLANDPAFIDPAVIKYDDEVKFGPEHIIDIYVGEEA